MKVAPDLITEIGLLLKDIELLMRVNAPMNDGMPMHKAVLKMMKKLGVEV